MILTRSLRRRVDYSLLRWQARLDGAWADRVLPGAAMVGLFVVLAAMSLARARSLETGYDLAAWVQGSWKITSGRVAESTITDRHLLEPQLAFGFYGVAQLTRLVAPIPLLLALQAAALAAGVGAVWQICRQVCSLRVGAAAAAVVAYAAFPPLHQLNLADFHPEALAVPALLWGGYHALRGRWWWAIPLFVLAVSMRSDLGLTVAAIGGSLVLAGSARGGRRLIAAGVTWTVVAQFVVQPRIGDGTFVHQEAFARYGDDGAAIAWGIMTAPWDVLGELVARENALVLASVLLPVAFLPLLSPRRLLPFAPVVALAFIADVPAGGSAGAPLLVPAIVGIFLTLPFALQQIGRRNIERITVDRRVLGALVLAAATFFVLDAPSSPYAHPWEWGGRDDADRVRLEVIGSIPDAARVRSAPSMAAELAERRVIRPVAMDRRPVTADLVADVDVLVLDPVVIRAWGLDDDGWATLHAELEDEGFDLVVDEAGVVLFQAASDG